MTAEIHTLAGAYALNALPDEERSFFEDHLKVCEGCRQEVAELQSTASQLGVAAEAAAPVALKERVLAEVRRTRQVRPATVFEPQFSAWRRMLVPVAAALMVVVVGLAFALAQLNDRVASIEADAEVTRQVLTSPDLMLVPLDAPAEVTASFAYSASLRRGVFLADGLAQVGDERVYEVWLISDENVIPAGLFHPDNQGQVSHLVSGDLARAASLAVTIEPAGGVDSPTGDILINGDL